MSPILVRPVREQIEHDRIIRHLQNKYRRTYEVGINPGAERNAAVGSGSSVYPDLVLTSKERGRRLHAIVEVETGESVSHLEALAQWVPFAELRAALHLYVPAGMVEVARRLCEDNQIAVGEIWSYHTVGDDFRFALVGRSREAVTGLRRASSAVQRRGLAKPAARTARRSVPRKKIAARSRKVSAPRKKVGGRRAKLAASRKKASVSRKKVTARDAKVSRPRKKVEARAVARRAGKRR